MVKTDCFFLPTTTLLSSRSALFSQSLAGAAPIPPLALLDRKMRILRLSHSGAKDVEATDVLVLRRYAAQRFI
jgi:hypothetical protein